MGIVWGVLVDAPAVLAVGLLLLAGFAVLVAWHRRVERTRRRLSGLASLNAEALLRLNRDWRALPERYHLRPEPGHPYAVDLDVVGHASLLHLLDCTGTWMGEWTLGSWLLKPAEPGEVRERQAAVADLAGRVDLRDELGWRCGATEADRADPRGFLEWAEAEPWLRRRRGMLWAARISPLVLAATLLAWLVGLVAQPIWLLPLLVNLMLVRALVGPAVATVRRATSEAAVVGGYASAIELLQAARLEAPCLQRLQARLRDGDGPAAEQLRRLDRIVTLAQPTSSQLYVILELATLWNVHVLNALEGWQAQNGRRVRDWLAALGEAEALAALARLAHDHPGWAFPTVDPAARKLTAMGLGHPLLPDEVRVVNDVEVGPPGTFLLVTGSNMSGKSTLLRAIGLNVVLAQAGGPACAAALTLPPLALWTSMRVQDSLERGVSFFMAELERLKQVVDATARAAERAESGRLVLYLLDEILQGTNTAERQVAARRIIRLLLSRPAIGAVSTHDLTLAQAPELAEAAEAVYLTETVADHGNGPQMSFDYKLRPGIARSTNALRLMELLGLPAE